MEEPIGKIAVILTPKEAVVIAKLREFDYGDMVIKKKDGEPYQIVVSKSTIVTYEQGLDLEGALAIPKGHKLAQEEVVSLGEIAKLFIKPNGRRETN